MALGAMANDPGVQVKIVPVGLSYFHAHRFRSRAVVEFGTALDVPSELVDMFKLGGMQKREAVSKFLDLIYDALKTVTIRAPDYDTLMVRAHDKFSIHLFMTDFDSTAHPSCQTIIQNTRTASDSRTSR